MNAFISWLHGGTLSFQMALQNREHPKCVCVVVVVVGGGC